MVSDSNARSSIENLSHSEWQQLYGVERARIAGQIASQIPVGSSISCLYWHADTGRGRCDDAAQRHARGDQCLACCPHYERQPGLRSDCGRRHGTFGLWGYSR